MVTCGRGVEGVGGSWRRPRQGVLVPEVEGMGLPLTELLPYMKSETKQIKRHHKITKKRRRTRRRGKKGGGDVENNRTPESERKRERKARNPRE